MYNLILILIIGWEEPEDNLEWSENRPPVSDIDDSRPDACPCCGAPARDGDTLVLIGHGTYERWIKTPGEIRIRIRRFLCKRCVKTCSVLPHWLLPRHQYTALVILSSLEKYHVAGETAAAVTAEFGLGDVKHGWRTLRRWSGAFLLSTVLWGWLGTQLGVRKDTTWSRNRVRTYFERFTRSFTDRVEPGTTPGISDIVRLTLCNRVFCRGEAWSSLRPPCGRITASTPHTTRPEPPTQGAGPPRGPP